jgi:hypothetical protein
MSAKTRLPFDNSVIQHSRCLSPANRHHSWTAESVKELALKLPVCLNIDVDKLSDEWRLYQLETVPQAFITDDAGMQRRLDHYWRKIFSMTDSDGCTLRYPQVTVFAKAVMVLAHGNADVERGFSDNGHSITSERVLLSQASVCGLRTTRDGLKLYGDQPYAVPMTKDFLSLGRQAHASYVARIEEEKAATDRIKKEAAAKAAEEKEKKMLAEKYQHEKEAITCKEKELEQKEIKHTEMMDVGTQLFKEANEKLKQALKAKDLKQAAVAQAMLESAQTMIDGANTKISSYIMYCILQLQFLFFLYLSGSVWL